MTVKECPVLPPRLHQAADGVQGADYHDRQRRPLRERTNRKDEQGHQGGDAPGPKPRGAPQGRGGGGRHQRRLKQGTAVRLARLPNPGRGAPQAHRRPADEVEEKGN